MAHSRVGVFAVLGAIALSLQGCSLSEEAPPNMCLQFEFENGVLPRSKGGEQDIKGVCDKGFEYDGPVYECHWINRECLLVEGSETDVTDQCHDKYGFGPKGEGLKAFPEGAKPLAVRNFTRTWSTFMALEVAQQWADIDDAAAKAAVQMAAITAAADAELAAALAATYPADAELAAAATEAEHASALLATAAAAPAAVPASAEPAKSDPPKPTSRRLDVVTLPKVVKVAALAKACKKVEEAKLFLIGSVVASGSSMAAFVIGAVALAGVAIAFRASRSEQEVEEISSVIE